MGKWQTQKVGPQKTEKVLVVSYSGALNSTTAQDLGFYHLLSPGRKKRFTKSDPLTAADYDPGSDTVTLTPKGGKIPTGPLELKIDAAQIVDMLGRPVSGNSGGNYVSALSHGVSAAAVDALLSGGAVSTALGRPASGNPPKG